uniref:Uncharacterized protein n=1 Tax=Rhizophora mucronata TaxID=61149 RepID=A0A2P2IQ81_RHIMU
MNKKQNKTKQIRANSNLTFFGMC